MPPRCPAQVAVGQRLFVHYLAADVWHERILLLDLGIADTDVWMILTPDMGCYAEDLNNNLGVRVAGPGNSVPRSIGRGQAYRFDPAFPEEGEFEAYVELAEDYEDEERQRMLRERPILRSTLARMPRGGRAPRPAGDDAPDEEEEEGDEADEEEEEEEEEPADNGTAPGSGNKGKWRVFSLGGPHEYGDEVTVPASAVRTGGGEAALYIVDGWPVAAKRVKDEDLDAFMGLVAKQDARILPVSRGRTGRRFKGWTTLGEQCEEVDMDDWPLAGSRTASWCVDYLVRMGQTVESHHEDFVRRCKLERNSWGIQAHWQSTNFLKFLAEVDQCDLTNLVGGGSAFREMQTIEHSFQGKLRDIEGGGGGGSGRQAGAELAMFADTARLSASLMICPDVLDRVRQKADREGGLLRILVKSQEARAALTK